MTVMQLSLRPNGSLARFTLVCPRDWADSSVTRQPSMSANATRWALMRQRRNCMASWIYSSEGQAITLPSQGCFQTFPLYFSNSCSNLLMVQLRAQRQLCSYFSFSCSSSTCLSSSSPGFSEFCSGLCPRLQRILPGLFPNFMTLFSSAFDVSSRGSRGLGFSLLLRVLLARVFLSCCSLQSLRQASWHLFRQLSYCYSMLFSRWKSSLSSLFSRLFSLQSYALTVSPDGGLDGFVSFSCRSRSKQDLRRMSQSMSSLFSLSSYFKRVKRSCRFNFSDSAFRSSFSFLSQRFRFFIELNRGSEFLQRESQAAVFKKGFTDSSSSVRDIRSFSRYRS